MHCKVCNTDHEIVRSAGIRLKNKKSLITVKLACGHWNKLEIQEQSNLAKYYGGKLWQDGYSWVNVFYGSYWKNNTQQIDRAVSAIESDPSYSGGLSEYNVGQGKLLTSVVIPEDPPSTIDDEQIIQKLKEWIPNTIPDVTGAYNVFFPPNVTVTMQGMSSCVEFCAYHSWDGKNLFYTVIPYPCQEGCNECTQNSFDTLTMALSEEMTELKTDMQVGTGWLIVQGNVALELCDYCDENYVCKTASGYYVNAWWSNKNNTCWSPTMRPTFCEKIKQWLKEILHIFNKK